MQLQTQGLHIYTQVCAYFLHIGKYEAYTGRQLQIHTYMYIIYMQAYLHRTY